MAMHINIYLYLDLSKCRPADLPTYRHWSDGYAYKYISIFRSVLVPTCRPTGTGRKSTPSFGSGPVIRCSISGIDNNPAGITHACLPVDLPNILYCNVLAWGSAGRRAGRQVGGSAGRHQFKYMAMHINIYLYLDLSY